MHILFVAVFLFIWNPGVTLKVSNGKPKFPVIMVPGDGGSQFEARLNKPRVIHIWCTQTTKTWFPLWLNLELLTPFTLSCFVDNMRLVYNNVTRTTSNSPGVEINIPGFGNTSTVEWLDSSHFGPTHYFHPIVDALVTKLNYTRNVDIRGAPYDFRKAPNELGDYLDNLRNLVEETYYQNQNHRVVLVAHSMGNLMSLALLNKQPTAWKDKFIQSLVTLGGPWGGAVKTLRLMASGDNLNVFVVNPLTARPEQRSMTSTAWMLPYDTFWNDTEVLIEGPKANYTVRNYKKFFDDIDFPVGYMMRQDTVGYLEKLEPPQVEVHCLYGTNVKTPAKLKYTKKSWFDSQPDVVFGNGDGTVNHRSLIGCQRWKGKQGSHKVVWKEIDKCPHMEILGHNTTIQYLLEYLKS